MLPGNLRGERLAMSLNGVVNIEDLHQAAKRRLPKIAFDFIEGGVEDERALETNRAAYIARLLAQGAENALPQLEAAEDKAKQSIALAEAAVGEAVWRILYTDAAPAIRRAIELLDELFLLAPPLAGLAYLGRIRGWPFAGHSSPDLLEFMHSFAQAVSYTESQLAELTKPCIWWGHALMSSPDAEKPESC